MSDRVASDVTIAAPLPDVLAVILDVEAYPDWTGDVKEAEVLEADADGRPVVARFRVDAKVLDTEYTIRYDHRDDGLSWKLVESDMLSQLDGDYQLASVDDATQVTYTLEVSLKLPLPGFIKKRAAKQILDTGLTGLKRRVESGA